MPLCPDCSARNPISPVFSKAKPVPNTNCQSCGKLLPDFQNLGGNIGKTTELLEGVQIQITDLSDSLVDRFKVDFLPFIALTASLDADAFRSSVEHTFPILWGVVIDQIDLSWSYNKGIVTQTLVNYGGLSEPSLVAAETKHQYTGLLWANSDLKFTLQGDDGAGQPGSIASSIIIVTYGNYRGWGAGVRHDQGGTSLVTFQAFIEDLINTSGTVEISVNRLKSPLIAESIVLERDYYFYPKRFGFATFYQNGIPGGYLRLKNVNGVIQVATFNQADGDESDLLINNGEASEAFYIYMSSSDNIAGAQFDVQ